MHRYLVREMQEEDVDQVIRIDREAFPNDWPPTSYRRELHNRLAHYIVVVENTPGDEAGIAPDEKEGSQQQPEEGPETPWTRLTSRIKNLLASENPAPQETATGEQVVGFAGLWVMLDEAHLSVIAVKESHRRRGLGELLLIASIQKAIELNTKLLTLEARVSNLTAQELYKKFGFEKVGLRRAYYTDNREDAVLMTLHNIDSPSFQTSFEQLKKSTMDKLASWQAQAVTAL